MSIYKNVMNSRYQEYEFNKSFIARYMKAYGRKLKIKRIFNV